MFLAYIWLAWTGIVLGRLSCPMIVTPLCTTVSPGSGQLAVAAGLGGEVDDDRAGPHPLDRLPEIRRGAGRPGTAAVVMTTSDLAAWSARTSCCLRSVSAETSLA